MNDADSRAVLGSGAEAEERGDRGAFWLKRGLLQWEREHAADVKVEEVMTAT